MWLRIKHAYSKQRVVIYINSLATSQWLTSHNPHFGKHCIRLCQAFSLSPWLVHIFLNLYEISSVLRRVVDSKPKIWNCIVRSEGLCQRKIPMTSVGNGEVWLVRYYKIRIFSRNSKAASRQLRHSGRLVHVCHLMRWNTWSCALLGYYATSSGNFFTQKSSVPIYIRAEAWNHEAKKFTENLKPAAPTKAGGPHFANPRSMKLRQLL